jgi:hypothetical protein
MLCYDTFHIARRFPAALNPRKGPPVPTGQEAGWASVPVWTQRLQEKSLASAGDRTLATNVPELCRGCISVILRRDLLTCSKIL